MFPWVGLVHGSRRRTPARHFMNQANETAENPMHVPTQYSSLGCRNAPWIDIPIKKPDNQTLTHFHLIKCICPFFHLLSKTKGRFNPFLRHLQYMCRLMVFNSFLDIKTMPFGGVFLAVFSNSRHLAKLGIFLRRKMKLSNRTDKRPLLSCC